MNLIIDVHEHPDTRALWESFIHPYHKDIFISFQELPAGDITTDSMKVGFEFKKERDFKSSISDGRLPKYQPAKLLQTYEQAYIIVAGTIDTNDNIQRETMASCYARGVPVIQVPTFYDVMMTTVSILCKCNDGKDRSTFTKLRPKISTDPQLSVISGIPGVKEEGKKALPGISEARAQLLLDKFGSPRRIAEASLEELMTVDGISNKLANLIYHTLNDKQKKDEKSINKSLNDYPEW